MGLNHCQLISTSTAIFCSTPEMSLYKHKRKVGVEDRQVSKVLGSFLWREMILQCHNLKQLNMQRTVLDMSGARLWLRRLNGSSAP